MGHSAALVAKQLSPQDLKTLAYALEKGMEAEKALRKLPDYAKAIIYAAVGSYCLRKFLKIVVKKGGYY